MTALLGDVVITDSAVVIIGFSDPESSSLPLLFQSCVLVMRLMALRPRVVKGRSLGTDGAQVWFVAARWTGPLPSREVKYDL